MAGNLKLVVVWASEKYNDKLKSYPFWATRLYDEKYYQKNN